MKLNRQTTVSMLVTQEEKNIIDTIRTGAVASLIFYKEEEGADERKITTYYGGTNPVD